MESIYLSASIWLFLALLSAVIAYHLRLSIALIEICVGVIAGYITNKYLGANVLDGNEEWVKFLAGSGAIFLTFLAGAELDPTIIKAKFREVMIVGTIGFLSPFIGCALFAYFILGWDLQASLLCGIALSTTSMAVVYAVMLETGLNMTEYGKGILGACFVNDIGTVLALGIVFAPFTYKTIVFIVASVLFLGSFPYITNVLTKIYGNRTAAIRTKWISFSLFVLATLALWSENEPVLPAYLTGMVLAEFCQRNHLWLRRLRTLTVGFLTPFYFLRAGTFISVPALLSAPIIVLALLFAKVISKIFGLYPVIAKFREKANEKWYYTLLMSTGLTFGTISALFGYSHNIITKEQYSFIVIAVIGSAVIPTAIASYLFTPTHLLTKKRVFSETTQELAEE
ncbi:MAG: cation:proton antiporter [Candidatus Hydrogenedentes bacterium]|nr:cation:proton antiporter [Candidatus Hydrogenedentota bacterium]